MNKSYFKSLKQWAIFWLIIVVSLIGFLFLLLQNSTLNTNVLSLLPKDRTNGVPSELADSFQHRIDKQLIFLVKNRDEKTESIEYFYDSLKSLPFIEQVNGYYDDAFQQKWYKSIYDYRYQLIDDETRSRLNNGTQFNWILSQLYSPFSGLNSNELQYDPLLLMRSIQLNQIAKINNFTLKNNWLTVQKNDESWYFIHAELSDLTKKSEYSHDAVLAISALIDDMSVKWPDVDVLKRGVIFYSDYASSQAKNDISFIGFFSILGIIILILVTFKSIRPILLTVLSILIGILCGICSVLFLFGEIHVITLVMSTSIIGVAVDYSLHYLTERLIHGNKETPKRSLDKLFSTLIMALSTTLITYFVLFLTPFPGLKQLSIFAVFGLSGAFLTVIFWYPFLVKNLPTRVFKYQTFFIFWLNGWQNNKIRLLSLLLISIYIGFGLSTLKINDDIAQLQTLPAELKAEEETILNITNQTADQKWFIVFGKTAEETLQNLERFIPILEEKKSQGLFDDYRYVNLPSIHKQASNVELIEKKAGPIIHSLKELGLPLDDFELTSKRQFITPSIWVESELSQSNKLLWFSSNLNSYSATLVPIMGIHDTAQLAALSDVKNGVVWVDKRTEFNAMFSDYRSHISYLLIIITTLICGVFFYRNLKYGVSVALRSFLPTLISIGCGLATLSLFGYPLNLFSVLALILVIGIGVDYSLFLSNYNNDISSSLLSIFLAMLTTLLSFGLLALSHTNAIIGFSLVLIGGIFSAFVFSPLVISPKQMNKREK